MKHFVNCVKITQLLICIGVFSFNFSSCKKFVVVDPPPNQVITNSVFSSDQSAISAMIGLYSQIMSNSGSFASQGATLYLGLSADELVNNVSSVNVDGFRQNSLAAENGLVLSVFWQSAYRFIYHANAIIEGLNKSSGISSIVKNQLIGEAKILRSFCYLYLINLYGDVPLETTTDYRINSTMPRTNISLVYQLITDDLKDAQSLLHDLYPSSGRFRPNKWVATALLARVYLYQNDWNNAEIQSNSVINCGIYSLVNDLNSAFVASSNEAIWQLSPVAPNLNTWEGNNFIPSSISIIPSYFLDTTLLNSFEAGDLRKNIWIKGNTVGGITYFYPYKYKIANGPTVSEPYNVLRLAEQYLIRAEARAQQGKLVGLNSAEADINIIRARALLGSTIASTKEQLLTAIEKERRTELFVEWGHRWFDLKRSGKANTVLPIIKTGWQSTDALYPIPLSQLQTNIYLTQNPGY